MTTFRQLWQQLIPLYDEAEARAVVLLLLDMCFSMSRTDIYGGSLSTMTASQQQQLGNMMRRLAEGEPVQYVTGKEMFSGRLFNVAPGVLIPRPETEELTAMPLHDDRGALLDIGTGSGCIAITMKLNHPHMEVSAWDISDEALAIARRNATELRADVTFEHQDILRKAQESNIMPQWDVIVSNPPYICEKEKTLMHDNVLRHEPHQALFVPDSQPLLFYEAIADYARHALMPQGELLLEINPLYAQPTSHMLAEKGFTHITIHHDTFGKQRFATAHMP